MCCAGALLMGVAPRTPGGGKAELVKVGSYTANNEADIVFTAPYDGVFYTVSYKMSHRSYGISSTGTLTTLSEDTCLQNWNSSYGDVGNGTVYVHKAELKKGQTVTLTGKIFKRYLTVFTLSCYVR